MSFSIELDRSGYRLTASRSSVVGPLRVVIDGQPLPDAGWTDFVLPVLDWWLDGVRKYVETGVAETRLDFMDGPWELRIRRELSGHEVAVLRNQDVKAATIVATADLLAEVEDAARRCLSVLAILRIDGEDVRRLAAKLS